MNPEPNIQVGRWYWIRFANDRNLVKCIGIVRQGGYLVRFHRSRFVGVFDDNEILCEAEPPGLLNMVRRLFSSANGTQPQ